MCIRDRRVERHSGQEIADSIVVKKEFDFVDFCRVYHSLSGNAFGVSNTLIQTGPGRPCMKSTQLSNLYYAGQSVPPGGGSPLRWCLGKWWLSWWRTRVTVSYTHLTLPTIYSV
eukprot:TRINITY_DN1552_c0_g1_i2.p1 TRINITY_DN1552_c0_g1~~TRINITY_DN1552_c0_g1_i2.p1  ORF type:complete len:114 (+),score=29.32 TRINITY_DN1552_c0_g1_i2:125-466(+)